MERHESQRGYFAYYLLEEMRENEDIILIVGDLGYKVFDQIAKVFPDRFYNVGAAEQAMLDIGVGMALEGKIPFCYSITPFLLFRPFETIRTYIDHEKIPVKLVGSGRDDDYKHDGFSHFAGDDKEIMFNFFKNIKPRWPNDKKQVPIVLKEMIKDKSPYYLNLTR